MLDRYRLSDPPAERDRVSDIIERKRYLDDLERRRLDDIMERRRKLEEPEVDVDMLRLQRFEERWENILSLKLIVLCSACTCISCKLFYVEAGNLKKKHCFLKSNIQKDK